MTARLLHHTAPCRDWLRLRRERLAHHVTAVGRLRGIGARVLYVIDMFRHALARITGRAPRATPRLPRAAVAHANRSAFNESRHLERAFNAHILAVRRYRRRPYDGTITLIATEEWCQMHPSLGWGTGDRLEMVTIPGRHETFMREQVDVIADVLRTRFERI